MTITLTTLTKNQWYKVGKVAIWLILSAAVSAFVAWVSGNADLLAIAPVVNLVGVALQQVFKQEEDSASAGLPVDDLAELDDAANKVQDEIEQKLPVPGTTLTPTPPNTVTLPKQIEVTHVDPSEPEATAETPTNGVQ